MTAEPQDLRVHTVPAEGPVIGDERAATDLIGDAFGAGAQIVAVPLSRLSPDFFRLGTGVAGAIVQKFANYRLRLVVLGDVEPYRRHGGPVADWLREADRGRELWFVADEAELRDRLSARS